MSRRDSRLQLPSHNELPLPSRLRKSAWFFSNFLRPPQTSTAQIAAQIDEAMTVTQLNLRPIC